MLGIDVDRWEETIFNKVGQPLSKAIVYTSKEKTIAKVYDERTDRFKTVSREKAGVNDLKVIQDAYDRISEHDTIVLLGTFYINGLLNINKQHTVFNASSAHLIMNGGGLVLAGCDWSTILINRISGETKDDTFGIEIKNANVLDIIARHMENLQEGIKITGETLDTRIDFGQIGTCENGVSITGYNIQGLRLFGNFINIVDNAGIYIKSTGFWWNYIDVVAIDPVGGKYCIYTEGTGYGNRCRVSGFLSGSSLYSIYDKMGGWWFEVPERWNYSYSIIKSSSIIEQKLFNKKIINGYLDCFNLHTENLRVINGINAVKELTGTNLDGLNSPSGVTITQNNDGTFRYSATSSDNYVIFWAGLPGSLARYVVFKYRYVSGGADHDGIYYTTANHTYSPSYYIAFGKLLTDGEWHTKIVDMWKLDDWKNSTIRYVRLDLTTNDDSVFDIAFIGLMAQAPQTSYNFGTAAITADGTTTTFYIPHGLAAAPKFVSITPKAGAPEPDKKDWDDTNIILTFTTAPAAGTYYYAWEAKM